MISSAHLLACAATLSLEAPHPALELVREYVSCQAGPHLYAEDVRRYLRLLARLHPDAEDRLRALSAAVDAGTWGRFSPPAPLCREQLAAERRGLLRDAGVRP